MMWRRARTTCCVVSLAAAAFAPACAPLRLPARSSGPATSREGVQVALVRQSCTQNVDPDFPSNDLVEEVVEVQIRNATSAPLSVHRDAFRLVAPDGVRSKPMTWKAAEPLALKGGDTRTFELRFMTRGELECTREMTLDADAGLQMDEHPIELEAIAFLPSSSRKP